ncbi:MAG: DUF721 domain-containing protein [Desulfonatronovibrionaceae bacterium]
MGVRGSGMPEPAGSQLQDCLRGLDREGINRALVRLWSAWSDVFGPEMSAMLRPLGHKKQVLIVGCEDSLIMQEMNYFQKEILRRVNSFLQTEYFDKVRLELLKDHTPLDEIRPGIQIPACREPQRPRNLGRLRGKLPSDSQLARCYEKYVAFFEKRER